MTGPVVADRMHQTERRRSQGEEEPRVLLDILGHPFAAGKSGRDEEPSVGLVDGRTAGAEHRPAVLASKPDARGEDLAGLSIDALANEVDRMAAVPCRRDLPPDADDPGIRPPERLVA
jgi:hypothetical protein